MSRILRTTLYTLIATGVLLYLGQSSLAQDPPIPADTEIVTTASGLKYSILKKSASTEVDHPKLGDRVKVHYTGWLTSGEVFDSSRKHGKPADFLLTELVAGWQEGLQLMTPGDTFKLTVPPELGYGAQANGAIPPNSTLVFELELLAVTHAPVFAPLDPAQTKTTASGLKYQVLQEGEGRAVTTKDAVEIAYAFWTSDGVFLEGSAFGGQSLAFVVESLPLPFLVEAAQLMKPGSKLAFEVPSALGFGSRPGNPIGDQVTLWQLELLRILDVPAFEMPDDADLTTTASGLKYKMLVEGTGKSPKMYEYVTCNYSGWLTDGKLFDSSRLKEKPIEFLLGKVIEGWNEGLQLMKEGGSAVFVIPPGLAYGKQRYGQIPPDSTLVFRIDLIQVGRKQ